MTNTYLARQLLLSREKMKIEAAVSQLVGMQAQLAKPPYLGLWTRIQGVTRAAVNELFLKKKLVRGTAMRGTLHVMTAADFLALRMTLQPGLTAGMKAILRDKSDGLPLAELHAFARTKFPCTMDALRDELAAAFPKYDKRAMAFAVRCTLPVVQVPDAEEKFAFSSAGVFQAADTWLGKSFAPADPTELVRRYLRGYGPATIKDAQTWAGTDLREGFAALKAVDKYFDLPKPPSGGEPPPRLIPAFDNLVLAHHDRDRIIDQPHRAKVVSKNLQVAATFLVGGRVAGTWKFEKAKLSLSPFGKVAKADVALLEAEAAAASDLL